MPVLRSDDPALPEIKERMKMRKELGMTGPGQPEIIMHRRDSEVMKAGHGSSKAATTNPKLMIP